jgi:hypothetical protein
MSACRCLFAAISNIKFDKIVVGQRKTDVQYGQLLAQLAKHAADSQVMKTGA